MIGMGNENMKGFFFVVAIFLILTYILLSISIWTKALEESERHFSDRFRTSNIDLVASGITQEKLERLSNIVAYNALFRLNAFAVENPVKAETRSGSASEFFYVNRTLYGLIYNGTADGSNFVTSVDFDIGRAGSVAGWIDRLNSSIAKTGMHVSKFLVYNFSVEQIGVSAINYSFDISLAIEEKSGIASIERKYSIHGNVTVDGLIDPAIKREDIMHGTSSPIEKQFFFYPAYVNTSNLTPTDLGAAGGDGQGWFYGPLVRVGNAGNISMGQRGRYILVGTYSEIFNLTDTRPGYETDYGQFGAYVLTNSPRSVSAACIGRENQEDTINALYYTTVDCETPRFSNDYLRTNNPLVVIPGFNTDSGGECPDGRCLLFITRYSPEEVSGDKRKKLASQAESKAYNIEKLRDFALCSYYVRNFRSPSYFQRLFADAYSRNSSSYGIETFLIGKYIGGAGIDAGSPLTPLYEDERSRADNELFLHTSDAVKIRGMPGCKDYSMCSEDSLLGHFRLGPNSRSDFLDGQDISCANGKARCD